MNLWVGIKYWTQHVTSASIFISLQIIYIIIFMILLTLPFCVGVVVIFFSLFLSITRPFPPVSTNYGNCACRSNSGVANLPENACVLLLLRRQRNDYLFFTPNTFNNNVDRFFPLRAMLSNYYPSRTTMEVERALVLIPPTQLPGSYLVDREQILSRVHSSDSLFQLRGFPQYFHNQTLQNNIGNFAGGCNRTSSPSLKRLKYLDVSLREYTDSPQNLYKEKRPIQFKFLPDA